MWKKKEEKKEEKEESLLKELCGDDAKLYDFLSYYMYENPLAAISKKGSRYPHRGGGKKQEL
jgi:hypothetical protein